MVLGDRGFDPDGVTGIQRNKGKHLGIALNINRGPSRRHSRLSRLSGKGGDPLAVILDFPVFPAKAGTLSPSFSTFQLPRRSLGDGEVGNPENKESCFPMQLAKEVRHQCLACFGSIQSSGAS